MMYIVLYVYNSSLLLITFQLAVGSFCPFGKREISKNVKSFLLLQTKDNQKEFMKDIEQTVNIIDMSASHVCLYTVSSTLLIGIQESNTNRYVKLYK